MISGTEMLAAGVGLEEGEGLLAVIEVLRLARVANRADMRPRACEAKAGDTMTVEPVPQRVVVLDENT